MIERAAQPILISSLLCYAADEVSQPGQQHASGEEQQAASDMQAEQENLVPAGFAGTVVQAYMSLNYV